VISKWCIEARVTTFFIVHHSWLSHCVTVCWGISSGAAPPLTWPTNLWNLELSQWWTLRLQSSGMWHIVVW